MLEANDLKKIQEKMDDADKDNTPFVVIDGEDRISVVGDANKTEVKKKEYSVKFRLPSQYKDLIPNSEPILDGKYYVATVKFNDVMITPRKDLKIVSAITSMIPFLRDISPSGDVTNRKNNELEAIVSNWISRDYVVDAMYDLVAAMLEVDFVLKDMMVFESVLENTIAILNDFPEVLNESDFFTDQQLLIKRNE